MRHKVEKNAPQGPQITRRKTENLDFEKFQISRNPKFEKLQMRDFSVFFLFVEQENNKFCNFWKTPNPKFWIFGIQETQKLMRHKVRN